MQNLFDSYWKSYSNKTLDERREYFDSLSRTEKRKLIYSFWRSKWSCLLIRNFVDHFLDSFKEEYSIDIYELRVQAIKNRKVFLIPANIWNKLISFLYCFHEEYDLYPLLGELEYSLWGKSNQFYKIHSNRRIK